jgi:hypothetical protein
VTVLLGCAALFPPSSEIRTWTFEVRSRKTRSRANELLLSAAILMPSASPAPNSGSTNHQPLNLQKLEIGRWKLEKEGTRLRAADSLLSAAILMPPVLPASTLRLAQSLIFNL